MIINIFSPVLYILYVKIISFIPICPKSLIMKKYRRFHNIFLSFLSFIMLVGITYSTYTNNKFISFNNLLCKSYNNDKIAIISSYMFLYSKYLEWGDTLFLHLSGKNISMLQYTHHMTTAFLVYIHLKEFISPLIYIYMALNCFVHVLMYWYFAFPRGFLFKFRKLITKIQIIQHIICISTSIYIMNIDNCKQNKYGLECGLILYGLYLFYFLAFYLNQ